jgi:D-glycero-alpha-D-manno-heptose-7-phosphate kinase
MIISRTPLRLPLGGGGTDLPTYYRQHGGFFVSGALDKYVYIALNKRFENSIRVSYSKTEIVDVADQVQHPLVREALKTVGIKRGIEIISIADVPAATGLGSSGSFCVGLLNALHTYLRERKSMHEIAEEACEIEMQRLKEPSGKQDEYVASFGGICAYEIYRNGAVKVSPVKLSTNTLAELESNILMFYTGITRNSSAILSKQQKVISEGDEDAVERMHRIKQIGLETRKVLEANDLSRFGELLHEHWIAKRGVIDSMSSSQIDKWYQIGRENGAVGGKIIGAGGGGFLMFYCDSNRERLRKAMLREGLVEHRFKFEFEGSKIIYNV